MDTPPAAPFSCAFKLCSAASEPYIADRGKAVKGMESRAAAVAVARYRMSNAAAAVKG